nr:immunoglobulin light chain junction region [Macaca mulatta]MOV61002.1 immunoglobulin light chain junction region [Macaca mulatta]MOV61099.1 immunoglobulin light chain junction region [Macaca mulatta]MOV61257.1 immunoglobulin light chain junction region [Macaca mulatta]MOV61631.1 immunoglobulin light chain junction region [Macaca mulatta]
CQHHHTYPYSF